MTDTSALERRATASAEPRLPRRSLGVFGGTFNPPHLGHIAVACHARAELGLERVLLMPAHTSPHKLHEEGPGAAHRLRMCRLAVEGADGLAVSALEIERGGRSYTVDTLRELQADAPDAELTFIVGADTAVTLDSWKEPARLLGLARMAVAARSGSARGEVLDTVTAILGDGDAAAGAVSFLEMGPVEVSSSTVRERLAREESTDGLLAPAVARYIEAHALYRAGAGALS